MAESEKQGVMGHYCEISTCMGIVDWYQETRCFGKLFWALIVVLGLVFTSIQTYGSFSNFFNSQEFEASISKEPMDEGIGYPAVTICNFNRAKKSLIAADGIDPKVLTYIFQIFPVNYDVSFYKLKKNASSLIASLNEYEAAYEKYLKSPNALQHISDFLTHYGHSAFETFITKQHNGIMQAPEPLEIITTYGRCWKFDLNVSQIFPGAMCSLNLIMDPMLDEYLDNVVYGNYVERGFAISLNDEDEPYMPNPIFLAPGTSTNINIKATKNSIKDETLPRYPKPCNNNPNLTLINEKYTPVNCFYDCYQIAINLSCGCVLFGKMLDNKIPHCNLTMAVTCAMIDPNNGVAGDKIMKYVISCAKKCIRPCFEYTTYDTSISTAKYGYAANNVPAMEMAKFATHRDGNATRELLENVVSLKIFYISNELIFIETGEKMPVEQFISDTGGQLGLWMGISIFSIVQFAYYVILAFCTGDIWCRVKRKSTAVVCQKPLKS